MRRNTLSLVLLSGLAMLSSSPFPAIAADTAPPSATPSTQPDPAADRLTFLTLQLSSIEASLNAVNLALRAAGYKAVIISEKANQAAMGNELMDRKGGAPIAWDKFYGATAKEFAPRDVFGVAHNYERPSQFDYLYRANNEHIAQANQEVSALGKKVDVLLARRRQLDAEQSALWATISWELVQNREIHLNPLYRFQLRTLKATPAADARRDVLRPAILFLRTIDKAVADDLDSLSTNQAQSLTSLKDRTEAAYTAAEDPFANAMLSADMSPDDLKTSRDLLAKMKHLAELSKNITEAYRLALDGDSANDDGRKLTFRAQLQFALLDYATATSDLDDQLIGLAKTWGLEGERGVANRDQPPASAANIARSAAQSPGAAPTESTIPAATATVNAGNAPEPLDQKTGWLPLFNGKDLAGWKKDNNRAADWSVKDGVLIGTLATRPWGGLVCATTTSKNFRSRMETMMSEGNTWSESFIAPQGGQHFTVFVGGTAQTRGNKDTGAIQLNPGEDVAASPSTIKPGEWFIQEVTVKDGHVVVVINGRKVNEYTVVGAPPPGFQLGLKCNPDSQIHVRRFEIQNLPDN